jgi:hypothetical protein
MLFFISRERLSGGKDIVKYEYKDRSDFAKALQLLKRDFPFSKWEEIPFSCIKKLYPHYNKWTEGTYWPI